MIIEISSIYCFIRSIWGGAEDLAGIDRLDYQSPQLYFIFIQARFGCIPGLICVYSIEDVQSFCTQY